VLLGVYVVYKLAEDYIVVPEVEGKTVRLDTS
jgi:hypothetical protein